MLNMLCIMEVLAAQGRISDGEIISNSFVTSVANNKLQ